MELPALLASSHSLDMRFAKLQGALISDRANLEQETKLVALAKGRGELEKEVGTVFEALQARCNERSVGAFEAVLSALLEDVMPGEGQIRFLTQYKSNDTYLDVMLQKPEGLEDIEEGNGGAVNNVVSAGLRYAALFRSKNRRLVVLDEPHCWVEPARIPYFLEVIAQTSRDLGAQTLVLTHQPVNELLNTMTVVRLARTDDGLITAKPVGPVHADWTSDEEVGLRSIELINVRAHAHTIIPCYPGPTAYIGTNNLGKSTAINTALKVVAYNSSNDSIFRHGTTEAKIILRLENNLRVEWSRNANRSPTVIYKLFQGDSDVPLKEGPPRNRTRAPEWVTEVLGIDKVDELDLQLCNQKTPVFLLNESAPKRASILAVGRESAHLKTLMKSYQELKQQDKEVVKNGEARIARLSAKLRYLERIESLAPSFTLFKEQLTQFQASSRECTALKEAIDRIEQLSRNVQKLGLEASILATAPAIPELTDTSSLLDAITKLERGQKFLQIRVPADPEPIPELTDTQRLLELGVKVSRLNKVNAWLAALPESVDEVPTLSDTQGLFESISIIEEKTNQVSRLQLDLKQTEEGLLQSEKALEAAFAQSGGRCPLCDAPHATTPHESACHV